MSTKHPYHIYGCSKVINAGYKATPQLRGGSSMKVCELKMSGRRNRDGHTQKMECGTRGVGN